MRAAITAAAALLLSGCTTTVDKPAYLIGTWGGPSAGIAFHVTADVLFDCASGSIDVPVYPAKDGSFLVKGTYREGSPGPVRVGQIFRSQTAIYSGTALEGVMTLNVELEDGTALGPYNLMLGAPAQLNRCV
ncbi:hypothetical protein LZ496_07100 [Sphingomonas sp. NSE70-1]|uniref:Lipoprotein n=1 Tax=Sphingomonas caseinilyticus TaxID=2908205 RepID=A0ABT0RV29_9SPHN|nr:hypothetical protein [Sphingomonas caseinilyticus]MCL6698550.1 hypothetical protein [Sphingomonas caseinilyticus]